MIDNPFHFGWSVLNATIASYLDAAQLAKLQKDRLGHLLKHAERASSFYKALYSNVDISNAQLGDIPVVHKQDLMLHFDAWVCNPQIQIKTLQQFLYNKSNLTDLYLGRYVVWESSGSSGKPGIFLQDSCAMTIYDALELTRKPPAEIWRHALNPLWIGERIAFVGAIGEHFASNVSFERIKTMMQMSSNLFKSFSILDPVDDLVSSLNEFQPTYLMTYPTAAVTLAEKNIHGSLKIRLRELWTGGETLTKTTHQFLERAFGSRVRNSYGASEFLPIARECDLGNLHVNSDWVILEAVDEKYQPIPDGHMSRTTLLTNLANEVQPLIRYDIGDSIRFHTEKCPCGSHFPVIDVIGRRDGLIRISNDKGEIIKLLPLALATVMEEGAGIFDFQIVQQDKTTLLLHLPDQNNHPHPGLKRSEATLRKYLRKQGASQVELIAKSIPKLILNRSGKLNRIIVGRAH